MPTARTAVIYARFSCNKQREASIDDQLRICRQWCQREKYAIVADILRGDDRSGCMSVMDRAADVEDAFRDLLNDLDIATGLSNYGVKREDLPACADRAFAAKRLLNNNPRAASRDQILALLEANFEA